MLATPPTTTPAPTLPEAGTCTVDDYLALKAEYPRYELLEGELIKMVSPTTNHQLILQNIFRFLDDYCRAHKSGIIFIAPMDVVLSRRVVVQPDLIFIAAARRKELVGDRIKGAPDLVVEILSPSTAARDWQQKRRLYARYGVAEYWLVDPDDHTIEIQRLQNGLFSTQAIFEKDQTLVSEMFPGLEIGLVKLFATE